jgi:hypothetical protein
LIAERHQASRLRSISGFANESGGPMATVSAISQL